MRDEGSIANVLAAPDTDSILRGALGRNDKIKALKETLRRRRFPHLARAERRAQELITALALPRNVTIQLPQNLEGDRVQLTLSVDSVAALHASAAALLAAVERDECKQLFALLEES